MKMTTTPDPEKLPALLELLGFSMEEFFNDDGSLKSHVELAARTRSLPYTLEDYHYQLTKLFAHMPPAKRFALFVQALSDDGESEPIHRLMFNFLLAIVGSIDAGRKAEERKVA
jgi:hypothetical protein